MDGVFNNNGQIRAPAPKVSPEARLAELVPDAIETLAELMGEEHSDRARLTAAVALLDRAGLSVLEAGKRDPLNKKNLAEMSSNDLAAIAERARLELIKRADSAKIISGKAQPIDKA